MLKANKWKLLFSSLVILLPMAAGLIMWNELPEKIPTHWNWQGEVDGWSSKLFAVVGLPLFMLLMHWFCAWATAKDSKNKAQSGKVYTLVLSIVPVVSVFCGVLIYSAVLGKSFDVVRVMPMLLGLMFIFIGNYLPKCKQNRTIGIKIKWALENEENWYATHRLAGRMWMLGGLLLILTVFLSESIALVVELAVTAVMVIVPVIYSYVYSKKHS